MSTVFPVPKIDIDVAGLGFLLFGELLKERSNESVPMWLLKSAEVAQPDGV
jgi:hypothetical protein